MSPRAAPGLLAAILLGSTTALAARARWTVIGPRPPDTVNPNAVTTFVVDPRTPTTLYVGTSDIYYYYGRPPTIRCGSPVLVTQDGGTTWAPASTGIPPCFFVNSLAIDPQNPRTLYAAGSDGIRGTVFMSRDAAATWTSLKTGLLLGVLTVVVDPRTPTTVYAGGEDVVVSTDAGATWTEASTGLPVGQAPVWELVASPLA